MMKKRILLGVFAGVATLYFGAAYISEEDLNDSTHIEVVEPSLQVQRETFPEESNQVTYSLGENNETKAYVALPTADQLPETAWLSDPLNQLSNELYDFIESEDVRYINTTDYPFDEEKQNQLNALIQEGDLILFDNTEPDYLDSYGVSEAQVVSEYFGTASDGDVIVATAVSLPDGGMHYLVLPLHDKKTPGEDSFINDVKQAVILLKDQKLDLIKPPTAEGNQSASST
tara:strand:- start:5215 stop:5904 length:690 start_codon:yes stop_codon:yes gene_type:complete